MSRWEARNQSSLKATLSRNTASSFHPWIYYGFRWLSKRLHEDVNAAGRVDETREAANIRGRAVAVSRCRELSRKIPFHVPFPFSLRTRRPTRRISIVATLSWRWASGKFTAPRILVQLQVYQVPMWRKSRGRLVISRRNGVENRSVAKLVPVVFRTRRRISPIDCCSPLSFCLFLFGCLSDRQRGDNFVQTEIRDDLRLETGPVV